MASETPLQPWLGLRFDGPREAAFIADDVERAQQLIRYTFPLVAVIYFLFWFGDQWMFQRLNDPVVALALGLPAIATTTAGLWAWRSTHPSTLMRVVPWLLTFNGVAMVVAVARCTALGAPEPYGIMPMHVLYVFFLAGLLTRDAVLVGLASTAAYLFAHLWFNELTPLVAERLLTLVMLVGIGTLGVRIQEQMRRRNWLLGRMLASEARHDQLTGLPNRRALFEDAEWLFATAAREGKPLSVLLLDVDHFKLLNDSRGHAAGDFALRQIAEAVQRAARRSTDIAARYGGEEFMVLLYDCDLENARERAEKLRAAIAQLPIDHPESPFRSATTSIGVIGGVPGPHDSLESWAAEADVLLYTAKADGRNRVNAAGHDTAANQPERRERYA